MAGTIVTGVNVSPQVRSPPPIAAIKPRLALYLILNLSFLMFVIIAMAAGGAPNPRFLNVILLFMICSTAVIDLDGLNGRYSLLAIFLLAYFAFFGLGDLTNMLHGSAIGSGGPELTQTEQIVLVGAVLLIAGYRIALSVGSASRSTRSPRDWSVHKIIVVGLVLWAIGTYAIYMWYFHVVTDTTLEATRSGLSKVSAIGTIAYILAQMMQPLGILLVAYAWRLYRSAWMLTLMCTVLVLQVILGFIIDIKGEALLGGVFVIVTSVLIDGKIPKGWVAGVAVFIVLAFPIFQAYRAEIHGNRGISRMAALENLGDTLKAAISAEEKVNTGHDRAQTFFERLSLKASVEMIVEKTGVDVPFQRGYTLTPILSAFVPKIIWSDKPDIPTGQMVNKVFHIADQEETYISPSHLGELYWNFGWSGVVVGMTCIGLLCGTVARFNLREARTVTRLLITVLTIRQVIQGFEGAIASAYVVYLRSMLAVGLLHVAFAKIPAPDRRSGIKAGEPRVAADSVRTFPNLLT